MTLEQAIAAYLDHLRLGRSVETVRTYRSQLRRFEAWLGNDPLSNDILLRYWRGTGKPNVAGVRAFLKWLSMNGHIGPEFNYPRSAALLSDAMGRSSYTSPKVDRRLGDIIRVAEALPEPIDLRLRLAYLRDVAILRVLFTTGMRRAEVAGLDRQQVADGTAIIVGKGGKERAVFYDEPTLFAISCYCAARHDTHRPIFLAHHHGAKPGQRISPQTVWAVVKKYSDLAGVPATPHKFRHLKAITLLNRGADLSIVQDILGHSSPSVTKMVYARYETRTLREAFDKYSATIEDSGTTRREGTGPLSH
jgi:site-specific recombinase XerD